MWVAALRVSSRWGAAFLLIPGASLAFLFAHWERARFSFALNLAGIGLCIIGFSLSPTVRALVPILLRSAPGANEMMISMPSFRSEKDKQVISNMSDVQRAIELYAQTHGGNFPRSLDEYKGYLPAGKGLPNPFSGKLEYPQPGGSTDLQATRASFADRAMIPGTIEYNVLTNGRTYVIVGAGGNGKGLDVISND